MLSKEEQQQILEFVTMHLATQGIPAQDTSEYRCVYITVDGDRCAIGCMMSEEQCRKFDAVPESNNVGGILIHHSVNGWTDGDINFLTSLQLCHDSAAHLESYIEGIDTRLRTFARRWDLRFPEELL